jgi:hypothetical protein
MRSQYDGVRSAGSEFSLVTSVDFFEFGVEANIEPPPRSDVTAFEDVIGRGAEETQHSEPEGS